MEAFNSKCVSFGAFLLDFCATYLVLLSSVRAFLKEEKTVLEDASESTQVTFPSDGGLSLFLVRLQQKLMSVLSAMEEQLTRNKKKSNATDLKKIAWKIVLCSLISALTFPAYYFWDSSFGWIHVLVAFFVIALMGSMLKSWCGYNRKLEYLKREEIFLKKLLTSGQFIENGMTSTMEKLESVYGFQGRNGHRELKNLVKYAEASINTSMEVTEEIRSEIFKTIFPKLSTDESISVSELRNRLGELMKLVLSAEKNQ